MPVEQQQLVEMESVREALLLADCRLLCAGDAPAVLAAARFRQVAASLQQRYVAHCQAQGATVLLPSASSSVTQISRPALLLTDSHIFVLSDSGMRPTVTIDLKGAADSPPVDLAWQKHMTAEYGFVTESTSWTVLQDLPSVLLCDLLQAWTSQ